MTHRSFVDRDGRRWDAWDVYPAGDRRTLERRQRVERGRLVERRAGSERRHRAMARTPLLGTDYGTGWLCFESGTERRRHAPVPSDWTAWDDARLEACCQAATRVIRRVAS
jgi:hypothetical protein